MLQIDSPGPFIRIALATLVVLTLIATSFWLLFPFLGATVWGCIMAITAYPGYVRLTAALGGRDKLSATIIALTMAALLFVPLAVLIIAITEYAGELTTQLANMDTLTLPAPPQWLENIPIIGKRLVELWGKATDIPTTLETVRPQIRAGILWFLAQLAASTVTLLQAAFAIVLAAIFLLSAPRLYAFLAALIERLGASDGETLLIAINKATRSVSKGILGTALIQATLAWGGFVIVGAPVPVLLAFISFILCSIQLGIVLIGLPLGIWLWTNGEIALAVFIVIWSIFVSVVDSVLKPILLGRDFPVPIWVIFGGLIGGLLAMGLIGLFIGPIILSVSYLLMMRWIVAT